MPELILILLMMILTMVCFIAAERVKKTGFDKWISIVLKIIFPLLIIVTTMLVAIMAVDIVTMLTD